VRLAYCMNLHAGESVEEIRRGIESITLPLRERLAPGAPFGIGMYLPAPLAASLARDLQGEAIGALADFLAEEALEPFTWNAFPYDGFQRDGLKERVFRPTWGDEERVQYTVDVARVVHRLWEMRLPGGEGSHLSISTHSGGFGEWVRGEEERLAYADGLGRALAELEQIFDDSPPVLLCPEAEPRSSAGDSAALAEFLEFVRERIGEARAGALAVCLDCCHSAVEFEEPGEALELARRGGGVGKLQFSSALALAQPARRARERAALLAMDEPRYLHQVTGRGSQGLLRCRDLPDLARALDAPQGEAWLACDEWRCHFHVPVDRDEVDGLATTTEHADAILSLALADPDRWTTPDLHLEIETYTWNVLPAPARGTGDLVDGLEREYRHALGILERSGWRRA